MCSSSSSAWNSRVISKENSLSQIWRSFCSEPRSFVEIDSLHRIPATISSSMHVLHITHAGSVYQRVPPPLFRLQIAGHEPIPSRRNIPRGPRRPRRASARSPLPAVPPAGTWKGLNFLSRRLWKFEIHRAKTATTTCS